MYRLYFPVWYPFVPPDLHSMRVSHFALHAIVDVLSVDGAFGHSIGKHVASVDSSEREHDSMIKQFTRILEVT